MNTILKSEMFPKVKTVINLRLINALIQWIKLTFSTEDVETTKENGFLYIDIFIKDEFNRGIAVYWFMWLVTHYYDSAWFATENGLESDYITLKDHNGNDVETRIELRM